MKPANPIYDTATARPLRVTVFHSDPCALHVWLRVIFISALLLVVSSAGHAYAQTSQEAPRNALTQLRHVSLPGDRLQIVLDFEQALIAEPGSFSIENPARLAFDFVDTRNALSARSHPVNVGLVQTVNSVEADGRTRVVLHLTRMMRYETRMEDQQFTILLTPRESTASRERPIQPLIAEAVATEEAQTPAPPEAIPVVTPAPAPVTPAPTQVAPPPLADETQRSPLWQVREVRPIEVAPPTDVALSAPVATAPAPRLAQAASPADARRIDNVDFRRGEANEGRVIIDLSDPDIVVEMRERANEVELMFPRTALPQRLERRLDTTDFATPVNTIDTRREGDRVRMTIALSGAYDLLSWQADGRYTLEARPLSEQERADIERERFAYSGERLSLNFQDIEVRSVLQLLADFTDLNIVVSDTVSGNITLRLRNVPWDQALDLILVTKGLDKRQSGSVIYVAPAQEIAERERQQLEAQRQVRELEPLRTEFIRLDYVKASEIAQIIRSEGTRQADVAGLDQSVRGFLSNRGHLEVHDATNTLLIRDTATQINEIRALIAALDIPVQQVLIESRVVMAVETFMRDIGTRFGVTGGRREGDTTYATSGSIPSSSAIVGGGRGDPTGIGLNDRLNVLLPIAGSPAGQIAFSILRPDILLDLEISAAQYEGRTESLASPRIITSNGKEAKISQGTKIPYQTTEDGTVSTEFIDAKLETTVTPQITPNGNLILQIVVTKDEPDWSNAVHGQPAIETREVNTEVFLRNGETVVLGGIYETSSVVGRTKVPLLGDIPVLGSMFRSNIRSSDRRELLIFVTPKIVDQSTIN